VDENPALLGYYAASSGNYDVSGQPIGPIFNGQEFLNDRLYRNVGKKLTTTRCVITRESEVLNYAHTVSSSPFFHGNKGIQVRFPITQEYFSLSEYSRLSPRTTQPPVQYVPRTFFPPGVQQPGHEAKHSPPPGSEVKKVLIYSSIPPYTFSIVSKTHSQFYWSADKSLARPTPRCIFLW